MRGLKKIFLKLIKKTFFKFGVEIINSSYSWNNIILQITKLYDINTILDVGANEGQFASDLRFFGYNQRIISFEPTHDAYLKLKNLSNKDQKWFVHERIAIGNTNANISINVSNNSVSSSIKSILSSHTNVEKNSFITHTEEIPLQTLENIYKKYESDYDKILLKIDTQGYEEEVIDGALKILNKVYIILIELSLIPLYENQTLWLDFIDKLDGHGFEIWSIQRGLLTLIMVRHYKLMLFL